MKLLKRIGAIVFACILMNSLLITTAFAATPAVDATRTTGTLTIEKAGSTFTIYKIFSMTLPTGSGAYEYGNTGVNANISNYFTAKHLTAEDISKYTTAAQTDPLINDLLGVINTNLIAGIEKTADGTTKKAVYTNLDFGYYLVVETATSGTEANVASKSFLVSVPNVATSGGTSSWVYDVTAATKDNAPSIKKVIVKGGLDTTTATQNVRDTVNYKLNADVPTYDASATGIVYTITDTMSKGLTVVTGSAIVTGEGNATPLVENTDYTVSKVTAADGTTTITINFTYANIKSYSKITVNYAAILNDNAVIGNAGNPNDVSLTYTRNPKTHTTFINNNHVTKVYTTGIAINKIDDTDGTKDLAGAVFELKDSSNQTLAVYTYDSDGKSRILKNDGVSASTDADGLTYFVGLNEGTYYIKEKTAPVGYSLIKDPIRVTITAAKDISGQYTGEFDFKYTSVLDAAGTVPYSTTNPNQSVTKVDNVGTNIFVKVLIADHAGFNLPGTGGIGTVIFMVSGISIVILGIFMLIIYNMKQKKNVQKQ